ncbi:DUF5305 domain-containing protein [Candidatus Saccharibacteria bacterium]|nr:DUF5305 domain-containing protein [Candidatus Saccharibacteria bacterium]
MGKAKIKPKFRFTTLAAICLAVAAAGIILLFAKTVGSQKPADYVHMQEHNTIDYRVFMKPNNGIVSKPYLGMNDIYTYDIVDHIEITNIYTNQLSQSSHIKYQHLATVSFVARVAKGGVTSDSDPAITDEVVDTLWDYTTDKPQGNVTLRKQAEINLSKYRDRYQSIKSSLDFTISGAIRIDFIVKASDGNQLNSEYKRSMTIPVSDSFFEIKLDGEASKATDFNAPARTVLETILLIAVGGVTIGAFAVMFVCIKKALSYKSWYRQEIDGLLHDYDDAIINTITPPDLKKYPEKITVEGFKELLQLATDIGDPIVYFENRQSATFYITRDKVIYLMVIKKTKNKPEEKPTEREIEDQAEKAEARDQN